MNRFILSAFFLLFMLSCNRPVSITDDLDYTAFIKQGLIQKDIDKTHEEIKFWQERLQRDENFLNMKELAKYHIQLFKLTGNVNELKTADSLLKLSSSKVNHKEAAILHALSQNAVTQHLFPEAYNYNRVTEKLNSDPYISHLLHFDAGMELGKYYEAEAKLANLKDKKAFDYLIRKAKLEDHKGHLDKAIILMEQAAELVKEKRKSHYLWALSNLADMYGHAGRIKDAYQTYLNVLEQDSANLYCLKGIAWIAFSHDKNTKAAKRILQHILSQTTMPDIYLVLAEIAEWEGDGKTKQQYISAFLKEVEQPAYGVMYNKYLIQLYTDESKQYDKALNLALQEVKSRPTPETYDWLAWVYYNQGDITKAYQVARDYVYKKTFEPAAMAHTAFIFSANGKQDIAKKIFGECLGSSFETGPVETQKIKDALKLLM